MERELLMGFVFENLKLFYCDPQSDITVMSQENIHTHTYTHTHTHKSLSHWQALPALVPSFPLKTALHSFQLDFTRTKREGCIL